MNKKLLAILVLVLGITGVCGCAAVRSLKLPENPKVFTIETIDKVKYITCDGRQYVEFGKFTEYFADKIDSCIGYIDEGETILDDRYICTIIRDSNENLITAISPSNVGSATVWRDVSTKDGIDIPEFVIPGDFDFWK